MKGVSLNEYNYYIKLGSGVNPDGSKATPGNIAWGKAQAANSYVIYEEPPNIVPPIKATGQTPVVKNTPVVDTTANSNTNTPYPTGMVNAATSAAVSEIDARKNYAANFTGWDNDSTLRAYQQKSMDIYVNTGRWDTPEQIQLHAQAEALRKSINLTYQGRPNGTPDKAAADALILPSNQPNLDLVSGAVTGGIKNAITGLVGADMGGMLKAGLGIGALFVVVSMFRGR